MHSSRMHTCRSLTVCGGEGCLVPRGVSGPRGDVCSRVSVCSRESVSGPGGGGGMVPGGIPACTEADTPREQNDRDRCKNITLATTSLRPVTRKHSSKMRTTRLPTVRVVAVTRCQLQGWLPQDIPIHMDTPTPGHTHPLEGTWYQSYPPPVNRMSDKRP